MTGKLKMYDQGIPANPNRRKIAKIVPKPLLEVKVPLWSHARRIQALMREAMAKIEKSQMKFTVQKMMGLTPDII